MVETALLPREHPMATGAAWEPRRQLTLEQARRHSRLVSSQRILFVSLAAASFSCFFGFMTLHAALGGFTTRSEMSVQESLRMINPRFTGRTQGGGNYTVIAHEATRRATGSNLIDLRNPVYTTLDGRRVTSTVGVYNQTSREIELRGNVVFTDPSGNVFTSTSSIIDGAANKVTGKRAVRGAGPIGSVRADSYEISDDGNRVVLQGHVRGVVKQKRGDPP
jgi:lipopolysaccharide export system protein LptC